MKSKRWSEEEHALLRDIEAAPEDDAPRLVFADWLAEHGEPDLGELIAVQCELAKGLPPGERRRVLEERELRLREGAQRGWIARLGLPALACWLRRGLPERLEMAAAAFSSCDFQVPANILLPELVLRLHSGAGMEGLRAQLQGVAASPNLERVHRLELSGVTWRNGSAVHQCGDVATEVLLTSPHLEALQSLTLRGSAHTLVSVRLLAKASLPSLRTLDLEGNELDDACARALAEATSLQSLRYLSVAFNFIGPSGEEALRRAFKDRVRTDRQADLRRRVVTAR